MRDNQNTPGAGKVIFKAAVYQTKAAMDHKALNATQLNEENKNHKYTIGNWRPSEKVINVCRRLFQS